VSKRGGGGSTLEASEHSGGMFWMCPHSTS
jgi:hypothetical protein